MRTIKNIHSPVYEPIRDLVTYRVIPTASIEYIDPFLFLNHHGPQVYPPNNNGLPFGPHPHRGMETVTFILDGDIAHYDSDGHKSVIGAGGVQWMTAGRGLIHSEVSSDAFKKDGGPLEILQLWVNLPARSKMADPYYEGLQKEAIPTISLEDGKAVIRAVSGNWSGTDGAFNSDIGMHLATLFLQEEGTFHKAIPENENIFFYVIRGEVDVNGKTVSERKLVEFDNQGEKLEVKASQESVILLGHAQPLNEPVVAQGPFVMNTQDEIQQAYDDYQAGKFGTWKH